MKLLSIDILSLSRILPSFLEDISEPPVKAVLTHPNITGLTEYNFGLLVSYYGGIQLWKVTPAYGNPCSLKNQDQSSMAFVLLQLFF